MAEHKRRIPGKTRRLAASKFTPPDWFGWLGVAAMFLLPVVRIKSGTAPWNFPLLSLGEWLLLPLGALSLSMGLLTLWKVRERTILPMWISAVLPAALLLTATGLSILKNCPTPSAGDTFLSWCVHLIFPTMAFLPLLSRPVWRDRLMWGLLAGVAVNIAVIAWQGNVAALPADSIEKMRFGGLLANQYDYSLLLAVALPLLAAWRGGNVEKNRALTIMTCTFLLPALALCVCYGWGGVAAASAGLAIALISWRSSGWLMGVFICLLVFGYGGQSHEKKDMAQRRLLTVTAMEISPSYWGAFAVFTTDPFLGSGHESFCAVDGAAPEADDLPPTPWYSSLLGGSGLLGLGMWLVLLGEIAARALGRHGKRCLWHGGVLGGAAGLAVAGLWVDALPEGAGAMVGLLLAVSILEEPEAPAMPKRVRIRKKRPEAVVDSPAEEPAVSAADTP